MVRPGDSLWAISRANRITVAQLAQANSMHPSDLLLIGRHLTIPAPGGSSAAPPPAVASTPKVAPAASASATGAAAAPTVDFCATFTPQAGPHRVLPGALTADPNRMALRPVFERWAKQYGVAPALTEAIAWQESGWQVGVVSSAQAVGVGQLLPSTAAFVGNQLIGTPLDINSANDNIRMSARYLAYLQGQEGSLCKTIASYYEGSVNMARYGVFAETQPYVASVEALLPRFE